jgi:hypothetical protein
VSAIKLRKSGHTPYFSPAVIFGQVSGVQNSDTEAYNKLTTLKKSITERRPSVGWKQLAWKKG